MSPTLRGSEAPVRQGFTVTPSALSSVPIAVELTASTTIGISVRLSRNSSHEVVVDLLSRNLRMEALE